MRQMKWKQLVLGAAAGFVLGFVLLHPFSMLFQGMTPPRFYFNFHHLADAFNLFHLPMAFFFGLLGLVVGAIIVLLLSTIREEKERIKVLEGLLPICSYCKKIRDDQKDGEQKWQRIEQYISDRTDADFTHGCCPDCFEKMMEEIDKV